MHNQHFNIRTEYADDLNKFTSDYSNIRRYEHKVEEILDKKGLRVNKNKTKNCIISRPNHQWKKCKLLGTLLYTEKDIKRRETLAINAANKIINHMQK